MIRFTIGCLLFILILIGLVSCTKLIVLNEMEISHRIPNSSQVQLTNIEYNYKNELKDTTFNGLSVFYYSKNGKVDSIISKNIGFSYFRTFKTYTNQQNNRIYKTTTFLNDSIIATKKYDYIDNLRYLIKRDSLIEEYRELDTRGLLVKTIFFDSADSIVRLFDYDKKSKLLIRIIERTYSTDIISTDSIKIKYYNFDNFNNWTERKLYNKTGLLIEKRINKYVR